MSSSAPTSGVETYGVAPKSFESCTRDPERCRVPREHGLHLRFRRSNHPCSLRGICFTGASVRCIRGRRFQPPALPRSRNSRKATFGAGAVWVGEPASGDGSSLRARADGRQLMLARSLDWRAELGGTSDAAPRVEALSGVGFTRSTREERMSAPLCAHGDRCSTAAWVADRA